MTDDRPPPSRRKSRLLLLVAGFFFFVPPVVVGIALYRSFDRPPDLAVDLPTDLEAKRAGFRARIEAAFPPGTREADLIATLKQQGFVFSTLEDPAWPDGRCRSTAWPARRPTRIRWRGDGVRRGRHRRRRQRACPWRRPTGVRGRDNPDRRVVQERKDVFQYLAVEDLVGLPGHIADVRRQQQHLISRSGSSAGSGSMS